MLALKLLVIIKFCFSCIYTNLLYKNNVFESERYLFKLYSKEKIKAYH